MGELLQITSVAWIRMLPFESWSPRSPRHAIGVEPARVRKLLPATVTGTMGQQLNKCE